MRLRMPFKLIKEEKALRKAINHFSEQPVYFQKKISFLVLKIKSDKHRRRGHPIFLFFFFLCCHLTVNVQEVLPRVVYSSLCWGNEVLLKEPLQHCCAFKRALCVWGWGCPLLETLREFQTRASMV